MKYLKKYNFLLVLLSLNLFACASVPSDAPAYKRLPTAPSGSAQLYFYRLHAFPRLRTPSVLVDDKLIFDPPEGAYTVITLPSGKHEVKVEWSIDTGWPSLDFPIELGDREAVYIKITGSHVRSGSVAHLGSKAQKMPRDEAEAEIRMCCRYIAPAK